MKIEKLYAVVEITPDYYLCEFLTTDLDEAERAVRGSPFRDVRELDLGKLVELLSDNTR